MPYPYYRPATYKAVGVDVKTAPWSARRMARETMSQGRSKISDWA